MKGMKNTMDEQYDYNSRNDTIILPPPEKKQQLQYSANQDNTNTSKQKGSVRIRTLITLCIICGIIGSSVSAGIFAALFKNNNSQGNSFSYKPNNSLSGDLTDYSGNKTSDDSKKQDVTIVVDNVSSPATAVAQKVTPSIVGIRVTTITDYGPYGEYQSKGEGSGVIYTENGYIITNYHVIEKMLTSSGEKNPDSTMTVYLNQNTSNEYIGKVIGYDKSADLAVIKIEASGLTAIEIGNSDSIKVGDIAIAIGNPGGLEFMGSTSQGIISGLNRSIQTEGSYENLKLIQTDAAINPGNSGGALCDVTGKLIGINSVKLVETGYESMGFAIPVNDVIEICDDIIKNGSSSSVYLGLEFNENFTAETLKKQGYPEGIVVNSVAQNSPAHKAGFETDDILTNFNGKEIRSTDDLISAKKECKSGDTVSAKVYRLTLVREGFRPKWVGNYIDIEIKFD